MAVSMEAAYFMVNDMEQLIIEGNVNNIIYQNSENGYTVFNLETADDEVICVGNLPHLNEGENLKIVGTWVVHPSYGKQLQVDTYEKTLPTTLNGIEKYLASGVIKGIGPKLSKKIIEKFGENTLMVIEEQPEKLSAIKGISNEKAMSISVIFHEQRELRKAMMYLQQFGISPINALKIYKRYKENTIEYVKENPYRLADDIFGIGFKTADKIAANFGVEQDSPYRIKSGIKYVLNESVNNGNVYLPVETLVRVTEELLGVNQENLVPYVKELQIEHQLYGEVIEGVNVAYTNSLYYAEVYTAKKLLELSYVKNEVDEINIKKVIRNIENETGINLAKNQVEAVYEAIKNGVLIITGGPGTGKTTTIKTIINALISEGYDVLLAAPTGRAAKRMSETTGMEAQTIHRLLGLNYVADDSRMQTFEKNEDNPLETDVVIIDESSMVDISLMSSLLKAVPVGTKLILVGDVDQLPSVGAGNVLKDIIKSDCIDVVYLTEIFRQAQESVIIMNAHRINKGIYPVLTEKSKDFFFIKRGSADTVLSEIVSLITERLPNYIRSGSKTDIQVLTPIKKDNPLASKSMNKVLQSVLNPPDAEKKEKELKNGIIREGDKIMQIKNNYNITWKMIDPYGKTIDEGVGIFNGDEGIVKKIDDYNETITVLFYDNKVVDYDYSQLDEIELSYAITIHKSQGSEYRAVIMPVFNLYPRLMTRNLLYTAVTRAKELVVLVGLPDIIERMVDNNKEVNRYSALSYRIKNLKNEG